MDGRRLNPPIRFMLVTALCSLTMNITPSLSLAAKKSKAQTEQKEKKPKSWTNEFRREIAKIDQRTPGDLGIYVKRLGDGTEVNYQADRRWYLASTVKVLVAIALLQRQEQGLVDLNKEITLQKSDYVDGSGEVLWKEPGTKLTLGYLLEKMLTQSDSTAADILIREIGVDEFNRQIQKSIAGNGFGKITTLLQVRYDAYGELSPKAANLTNMDFIDFKKAKSPQDRLMLAASRMQEDPVNLKSKSIDDAFEKYYKKGLNSGSLEAFGDVLEKLAKGQLLNEANTKLVMGYMETMVTGENRIKAGLPDSVKFAQKTGTQIRRICNVGIMEPPSGPIVVTACLEKFKDPAQAEKALASIGRALAKTL